MKNLLKRLLPALLCIALLGTAASAAEVTPVAAAPGDGVPTAAAPGPMRVWGSLTKLHDGGFQLKNSNEKDPYQEIILHGDRMVILDAVSGDPLTMADLKDGEMVYAYIGNAVTASLPPQGTAKLVLAHIPADFAVPSYYEITGASVKDKTTTITVAGGETVVVPETAVFFPYLTKNVVSQMDLIPGAHILAWTDMKGVVNRVMVFAYSYRGYLEVSKTGEISLSGEKLTVPAKIAPETLLPVRAVAEAMGYQVTWNAATGATISQGGVTVGSFLPGQTQAKTGKGDLTLRKPCVLEKGVTYLAAADLAELLHLYLAA
ncbi:MAG: stalk domain-containing protein [Oscillibacter sp.]